MAANADPMLPSPYLVTAAAPETPDVVSLTLTPVDSPILPPGPGQFVMIWVPAVGEVPISVSRVTPAGDLVLTVRSVGAVSAAIVGQADGGVVGIRGPFGTEWPVAEVAGGDVLVVAGGLGLAPLRMAVDRLVAAAAPQVTVVAGAREPDQMLYPADLANWAAAGAAVHTTVDAADRNWAGAVGTATAMVERLGRGFDAAFVCGPEIMMTTAARAATRAGTPAGGVWVSLERNMHCGVARCGRCQLGPLLLCRDGAVVPWALSADLLEVRGR